MPLLDIATPQPSFRNHLYSVRFQRVHHVSFIFSNEYSTRLGKYFYVPGKPNTIINPRSFDTCHGAGLMIKAVATLEPKCIDNKNDSVQQLGINTATSLSTTEDSSSSEDSTVLEERERLRRMRISKANKGNTPWNKGRKHSPETLRRIKERTRIAMQDPKVKMKLANLGHAQSEETRLKISSGVRLGWEKRREKLMIQETCHFEWLNLIAETARKGLRGEQELQWDSYTILEEQLKEEWIESVEQRKRTKPKGSRRAPKTPEQRKKISEAIAAKWADPAYRERVYSGISNYHCTTVGIEKPRRRRVTSDHEPRKITRRRRSKDLDSNLENKRKITSQKPKLMTRKKPTYKDPEASSKLEMIKSIRAQRAATDTRQREAIARAKLLIEEAERAAEALKVAADTNLVARASLNEARKLIAEATRYINSIETGIQPPEISNEPDSEATDIDTVFEDLSPMGYKGVNGVQSLALTEEEIMEFGLSEEELMKFASSEGFMEYASSEEELMGFDFSKVDDDDLPGTSSQERLVVNGKKHIHLSGLSDLGMLPPEMSSSENEGEGDSFEKQEPRPKTKRWVCGRLVEVDDDGGDL